MPDIHATLSASGAHRWLNCPPSALLEAALPDRSSPAAVQGTAAHALAEHKLRKKLKQRSRRPTSPLIDDEMENLTDEYVTFITDLIDQLDNPLVLVEQRLDFSRWVPGGFGTGDCVIISDGVLHLVDLKYGLGVVVESEHNPQLMLYALGALNTFSMLYEFNEIKVTIYQPRREHISTWSTDAAELMWWAGTELETAAQLAAVGEGEFKAGDWCRFCKLSPTCRARADQNLELAKLDFKPAPELTDTEIAEVLALAPQLVSWANDIQDWALAKAMEGQNWPGFKLVAGRSIRRYTDETAVAKAAKNAGYTDIYDQKLITLTAMEKLVGKTEFNEVFGELITKPAGKPALVPDTDKRPAITVGAAADFQPIQ